MSRPTKEQVENALKDAALRGGAAGVLAAEVRALRDELEQHKRWAGDRNYCDSCGKTILNIVTANAIIERVKALPAEWRAKEFVNLVDHHATNECAQELEAALAPGIANNVGNAP
jgi:oligoribonuclease NrnB/cAMP/cGMP phosphodiesterase (DHH superfamily)